MKHILFFLLFLLTLGCSLSAQNTPAVRFAHGLEILPENFASIRQSPRIAEAEYVKGQFVRYIQLKKIMDAPQRAAFEATGAHVIGYVPFGTYLVLLPKGFDFQRIASFSPNSVMPVQPDWKMANTLREQPYGAWAMHGQFMDINIQVYPHVSIAQGAEWCRQQKLDVLAEGTQNGYLQLRVHQERLMEIASLPFIQYLELIPPPSEKEDTRGRSLHRANLVAGDGPFGKKYDGTGVGVLVRDDGQLGPHIDLQGRLYNYANGAADDGTHGDGVAGIIGGAGNLNPYMKGMAAGADLFATDYEGSFQDITLSLHVNQGVMITNSSYSNGCNAGYTLASQTVDQQLFEYPTLMHVFSAGNSNGSNCNYGAGNQWGNITGGHKMAKNSIATANILADGSLVQSSSRGPAHDGRLKPDIAANGDGHESLDPNNLYQVFSGTSAAAPGVAGCLAQLTHAYRTIYGVPDAPAALLKTCILNTANDLGNVGPDFKFGWGHINAWRALQVLEKNQWLEGDADQNSNITHSLQIPSGVKEAKIMVYWAEPPAGPNNAKALINDLDLTVESAQTGVRRPWVLNYSPNPTTLDAPATTGRDSINNVEQVLLTDPTAGTYTIRIKGSAVPMGPQHYYIVWEFITDEIKVTYPAGGEGFAPGEVERIHWDAYGNTGTFTLRYSTDGGSTFQPIIAIGGDRRMFDWTVPNTVSGNVRILVFRGTKRDTTDFPCSIVPVPANLQITKVCPAILTLGFTSVNDTLQYEGYLLGQKYMEIKGNALTNSIQMPISNAGATQWASVRSSHPNGLSGRRANAISWPGGLLNCPQSFDLGVGQLLSPTVNPVIACQTSDWPVTVRVQNEGQNPATGAMAFYQVNNNAPIGENLPDINVGEAIDFTFQTPISFQINGNMRLKTWVVFASDVVTFNDTILFDFRVATQTMNQFFTQDFESAPGFPDGWISVNLDAATGGLGWQTTDNLATSVVGPDDIIGRSLHLNFFQYGPGESGAEDYAYTIPVDLTGLSAPSLTFEVAHARFNSDYTDGLRVEVLANCDLNSAPFTIWEKFDPELATVSNRNAYYYAGSASDWRLESADLSAFANQKILIRFVSVNGYGNSLYLDNIGINGFVAPVAAFVTPDTLCRLDTIVFMATPSTPDAGYNWSFGSGAQPSSATGIGPHTVIYLSSGIKSPRLIVANSFAADTLSQQVEALPFAVANFTVGIAGSAAVFTNTSTNSDTYSWDFGDGSAASTETNPTHLYALGGTYTVTLSASNACRTSTKTATVGATKVQDLAEKVDIRILPNPTAGDFAVELNSPISGTLQFSLFTSSGALVTSRSLTVKPGTSLMPFEHLDLPKGLYQLSIQSGDLQATYPIVVQ